MGMSNDSMRPYVPNISLRCPSVTFFVNFSTTIFELCSPRRLVGRLELREWLRSRYDLGAAPLGLLLREGLRVLFPLRAVRGRGVRERDADLERGDIERRGDLERDFADACDREGDWSRAIEVGVWDLVRDLPRDCASGDMTIEVVADGCTAIGKGSQSGSDW